MLGERKLYSSISPCIVEFKGLKYPISCLGFLHCYKGGFWWISTASSLPPLFFLFPPRCPLLKDSGKGVLQLYCLSWGHVSSTLDAFVLACSCSKLCFAQSFLKAAFIQCLHRGLQGHETSIYINLRHTNFASIMSDKSLIFSKDTGSVCRSRMSQ